MKNQTQNYQSKVAEFMEAAGQEVSSKRRELTFDEAQFRYRLLQEEIEELKAAVAAEDRVEILDALCDIKYVNDGTANMMGVGQEDSWCEKYCKPNVETKIYLEALYQKRVGQVGMVNELIYLIASALGFELGTFNTALGRVHESNMSKFCKDSLEAMQTLDAYRGIGIEAYWVQRNGLYVILRRTDDKVLKSIRYSRVNLEDLI